MDLDIPLELFRKQFREFHTSLLCLVRKNSQMGQNATALNSSARITQIEDVRAATNGGVTYTFTYNTDSPVPHLTGITNSINTAETYTFTYTSAATLYAPFSPLQSFGTAVMLQGVTQTGTRLSHTFEYGGNGAGELTNVVFPYQGELRWTHTDFTFSGSRTLREATERRMLKTSGATPAVYTITHPGGDSAFSTRSQATLVDAGGTGQRQWWFATSGSYQGMVNKFEQQQLPGPLVLRRQEYTWTQDANQRPYIQTVLAAIDPGQGYEKQSKTEQTLDGYGNLTQMKVFDFGNLVTPARTYANGYLTGVQYSTRYIFNRLTTASVTDVSGTVNLANNSYDQAVGFGSYPEAMSGSPGQHDIAGYGLLHTARGNATTVWVPGKTRYLRYPNQPALVDLAQEHRRGVTTDQANTLLRWAHEYDLPTKHGIRGHPGRGWAQRPHIHIGPVSHIPVIDP